jgi:acetoin utilization deacetylase AcuC-like enzyme
MTIISAGFDAARGDPLGGCDVCIFQTCLVFIFSLQLIFFPYA